MLATIPRLVEGKLMVLSSYYAAGTVNALSWVQIRSRQYLKDSALMQSHAPTIWCQATISWTQANVEAMRRRGAN
ncbi:hypothetical protein BP00DRAFT_423260 [Aspergillus indologenus CBS 114.80]|uniref:Uncharacterized protein n=1 Tax=Aspergillus indologenus CBS 114.80 TaxID=1450541 RepID=A0A2V5IBX3_9EURO|nr:hypothetical protein BP00DRAFT_423260 [Aspergillus indologenus CBS 114.80]